MPWEPLVSRRRLQVRHRIHPDSLWQLVLGPPPADFALLSYSHGCPDLSAALLPHHHGAPAGIPGDRPRGPSACADPEPR